MLKNLIKLKKTGAKHVLMCGLSGSGKTLLLYRTLIPKWENINSELEPTVLYHYEEFKHNGVLLGFWDFSGNEIVRNVPNFVSKQVDVIAVLFVVNVLDINKSTNEQVIEWLNSLYSEESLKHALFIVLFNHISYDTQNTNQTIDNFKHQLNNFKETSKNNFIIKDINSSLGLYDPSWLSTLEHITKHCNQKKK